MLAKADPIIVLIIVLRTSPPREIISLRCFFLILLQVFFFIFTNWKSRFRISLPRQKDSLYYTIFCLGLFFHLASLSEIDEPSFVDNILIKLFNIGKTFGLTLIYLNMLLIYSVCAYLIEVSTEAYFTYLDYLKFHDQKKIYFQSIHV